MDYYCSLAFADQIMTHTGGRAWTLSWIPLAGEAINRNLRVLRPFGRFLELGKRDFMRIPGGFAAVPQQHLFILASMPTS